MLFKIVYSLACQVLGLVRLVFRGDLAKDAEVLVLRHENAVLRRHVSRVRHEPADRAWLAALARLLSAVFRDGTQVHVSSDHPAIATEVVTLIAEQTQARRTVESGQ